MTKHYPEAFRASLHLQMKNPMDVLRSFIYTTLQEKDNPHNYRSNSKSLIFMRKITLTFLFLFVFCSAFVVGQTTVLNEPFDDASQFTVTKGTPFNDGGQDYFTLTDGSDIGTSVVFSGFTGQFLAAQDLDGEGGPTEVQIEWSNLDITGLENLSFSGLFAEDDSTDGDEDWDANSSVLIEYAIDGGSYVPLLVFEAVGGTNSEPAEDTNFDGIGDGDNLKPDAAEYNKSIPGIGSTLSLRLTISNLDAGDEDIAIDDIRITGTPASPVELWAAVVSDDDSSGNFTAGEEYQEGWQVSVYDALTDELLSTDTTTDTGSGSIPIRAELGDYAVGRQLRVCLQPLEGWNSTGLASDFDSGLGQWCNDITVPDVGGPIISLFYFRPPVELWGAVVSDDDSSGNFTAGEEYQEGWQVSVYDALTDELLSTDTTTDTGSGSIPIRAELGDYAVGRQLRVCVQPLEGWNSTGLASDFDSGLGQWCNDITVPDVGGPIISLFYFRPPVELWGAVVSDDDSSGNFTAGEEYQEGWQVSVYDALTDELLSTDTTTDTGSGSIPIRAELGDYAVGRQLRVCVQPLEGWNSTGLASDFDSGLGQWCNDITVPDVGGPIISLFYFRPPVELWAAVVSDDDSSGNFTSGEEYQTGWQVSVYDALTDELLSTETTTDTGSGSIPIRAELGDYAVGRQLRVCVQPLEGWNSTGLASDFDSGLGQWCNDITVPDVGGPIISLFYFRPPVELWAAVVSDDDSSGNFTSGEEYQTGWQVNVYDAVTDRLLSTDTTVDTGGGSIPIHAKLGDYAVGQELRVCVQPMEGWINTGIATNYDGDLGAWCNDVTVPDVGGPIISIFYQFNDVDPPTATVEPTNGATDVPIDTDIILTFNEPVQSGNGGINIYDNPTLSGSPVFSFSTTTGTGLVFNGSILTIDIPTDLEYNTSYYTKIDDGTIEDLAGNDFGAPGILSFTTEVELIGPEITNNGGEAFVVNFDENFDFSETVITDINATDDKDLEANDDVSLRLTYSLSTENGGGADNDLFSIASISGGVLPLPLDRVFDFENPMDADGDNNYEIQVTVTDSDGNTDFIDVTLTINDVDETPPVVLDVLISEFQPNPTGSDPANVTVELSGPAGESFTGWLLSIESDSGSSAGLVDRATEVSGTFDSNGLLLVSIPDFENPSFTAALMDAFTGTTSTDIDADNDGVADDLTTFGAVYDAIGIPDTNGEPLYGTDLGGLDFAYTGDEPRLVFRDASVGDWYAINDPDAGQVFDITGTDVTPAIFDTDPTVGTDTFGTINPSTGSTADILISEFQPNPTGSDPANVTVELSGPAGESFTGWLLSIESDSGSSAGLVDRATEVSGTFDSNGLLLVSIPDFENPSFTAALMDAFTGTTSTDIDADNDGVADDLTTFGAVYDAIGIPDTNGEPLYGTDLGGLDFAYTGDEPRLVFRDASVGDWYAINDPDAGQVFDITGTDVTPAIFDTDPTNGTDTFGTINPSINGTPANVIGITATDAIKTEGNSGTTTFTFTVTRTGDTSQATSVQYATTGDVDNADFPGNLPSGTVNFAANDSEEIIEILVNGDTDEENDESFTITLSNPANGETLNPISAQGTIQDDDEPIGALTLISAIQGLGTSVAITSEVTVEAIVVGDFSANDQLDGFFIQEEDADADGNPATSEGIFVYCGSDNCSSFATIAVGDKVQITGTPTEFNGKSQIPISSITVVSSGNVLPTASNVQLPVSNVADLEAYEGMLVNITSATSLVVNEHFNLDRFGEVMVSTGGGLNGRFFQYTQVNTPDATGYANHLTTIDNSSILVDDGRTGQNLIPVLNARGGNDLSPTNTLRGGDSVSSITGVMDFAFSEYRIQPTQSINWQATNTRPTTSPSVGGTLKVASLNVLNFFTTLDEGGNVTGPNNDDPRGADNATEYQRQLDKLVSALQTMNADIVGLVELENNTAASPAGDGTDPVLEALVDALNGAVGSGTYDFVDAGVIGDDVIKVAFIYKTTTVNLSGTPAILDTQAFMDPNNLGNSYNRPALAQTFTEIATNGTFTAVVNHLKSKGSPSSAVGADQDQNDGQGYWNDTRTKAAQALAAWLTTDPTGSGDPDFMILGDLNAYGMEDPIVAFENAGFTDLAESFGGQYSFAFSEQWGTLDYVMANASLTSQVTGAAEWHVNSDEPDALDYDTSFNDPSLYANDIYRGSDHDPAVVGLSLSPSTTASFDLQITEMWPGNDPGSNLTSDWFEIINNGTEAWVSGSDPDLFYDDDSQDPTAADLINGITDIQPGERVVIVVGDAADVTQFNNRWAPAYDLAGIEIGYTDGSGLGQGGDGVTLFVGGPDVGSIVDFEEFPDANATGGQSYDVELGEFSTVGNTSNAGATFDVNDEGQAAIASPGNQGPLAAVADLQITEMWPGNDPGDNLSEDWFEIINDGSAPWVSGVDSDLYYDDSPSNAANADIIGGLVDIQPGERVIVVIGTAADASAFSNLWSSDYNLTGIEIGHTDGSGLGQGGDGVTLWTGNPNSGGTLSDFESYPDAGANGGQSYDVELASFSAVGNASNAAATSAVNDQNQAAIASPGNQGPLSPSIDLQITEMWPGQSGTDLTADWFEIFNAGTSAWVSGTNPDLFYDDESSDPADALAIQGITDIQPGESVIVVLGVAADVATFNSVWAPDYDLTGIEVGHVDGSGLGGGGDAVTLWIGNPSGSGLLLATEAYPDTEFDDGKSYDVIIGAFSENGAGSEAPGTNVAVATTALGGDLSDTPAIGSPGNQGPLSSGGGDVDITVNTSVLTTFLSLSEQGPSSVSGVINDPTDPAYTIGIPFAGTGDADDAIGDLTITVTSSNQVVVPDANLVYTGNADSGTLTIEPVGVGLATITVMLENLDGATDTYTINYAASAASVTANNNYYHTGASDGSTAIPVDADYMWVGDDEDQTLRLYDRNDSGLPLTEINFNGDLGSTEEIDIEGSIQNGNTLYWIGSHATTDRSVLFSTNMAGSGASSTMTYGDKYIGLRNDLLNAGFGLPSNMEIEALAFAPGSTTAYLGFRVPDSSGDALIVPVTNFISLPGASAGSATFGSPINLDLGGRTLRSMECNDNGCVLIGGPNGTTTDFALYTWSGNAVDAPELRSADLTALATGGSFEGIVGIPDVPLLGNSGDAVIVQLMSDLGATNIYGNGENKDQRREWKKFRTDIITLGPVVIPPAFTDPLINEFVFDHISSDTEAFIEVFGDPDTDYSAFTLLEIEGDSGTSTGVVDAVIPLGTTDANGYWLDDEDAENGSVTLLLVEGFIGSVGEDLDTDDDGTIDNAPWSRIVDGVATSDGGANRSGLCR